MEKKPILLHRDELKGVGVEILLIQQLDSKVQIPHRDDHYIFIIQQQGTFNWELDFKVVSLSGPAVCFITPGQIHRYVYVNNCTGWIIFADPGLVSNQVREVFDAYLNATQTTAVNIEDPLFNILPVLQTIVNQQPMPLKNSLISSVIEVLSGLIASCILKATKADDMIGGQRYQTVIRYKQLITENKKTLKRVKEYAALLNITPLYLNEVVKDTTGFPASYWINQEILLEAKRLLYYTTLDIKQIAYELGYDDHAYFSRFFKKQSDITASDFRATKPLIVQS